MKFIKWLFLGLIVLFGALTGLFIFSGCQTIQPEPMTVEVNPPPFLSELIIPPSTVKDLADDLVLMSAAYFHEYMNRLSLQIYNAELRGNEETTETLKAELERVRNIALRNPMYAFIIPGNPTEEAMPLAFQNKDAETQYENPYHVSKGVRVKRLDGKRPDPDKGMG